MASQSDGLSLQPRDLALLRGLFESRVMTARHIAILYFDSKAEYTKKRLQQLKKAKLIGERERKAYEPAILFLKRKAFDLLRDEGILAQYPKLDGASLERRTRVSDLTIRHELEIMDVKAAFYLAFRQSEKFSIAEFSTWPLLYQFTSRRSRLDSSEVLVKPDGFIRIHEKEENGGLSQHNLFLEVDRSTEIQDTLLARANGYLNYHTSGGFAVWNGGKRDDSKKYPFRVLMIFKSVERRNNIAEGLIQNIPPIPYQAWLSTFNEVINDPLGAIWIRPFDYREVTKGTKFAPTNSRPQKFYKRNTEKEWFVADKIRKIPLFNPQ